MKTKLYNNLIEADKMVFQKLHVILAATIILSLSHLFLRAAGSKCHKSYCADGTWPDFTVQSLPFYGSAVAIDKRNCNRVIILHRSTSMEGSSNTTTSPREHELIEEDVVMILDAATGKILSTWGENKFVRPHGIEVTDEGDLYITDVRLHQVFKFLPTKDGFLCQTEPGLTLGERFVSGNDDYHFCSPADVAVMPGSKEIFIADGYCNSRVIKFDRNGLYLGEFKAGSSDPQLSPVIPFNVSHAVSIAMPQKQFESEGGASTVASTENQDDLPTLIFVADRNNGRIQCFTENGTFLYEIGHKNFGTEKNMIFSVALTTPSNLNRYGTLYAINGNLPMGQSAVFQVHVSQFGFHAIDSFPISNTISNNTATSSQRNEIPHDITVTPDGQTVYVIEAYETLTVKKFTRNLMTSKACPCRNDMNFFKTFRLMIVVSAIVIIQLSGLFL